MQTFRFRAMGTDVEIIASQSNVNEALELARKRMLSLEALLSRFRQDSDVSLINSRNGQWVEVSADTVQVLLLAQDAFQRTRGFFNPFMGTIIEHFGYSVTFEKIGNESRIILTDAAPYIAPIHSPLHIEESTFRARIEPGYKIDLGGIAKGWIVEQTSAVLTSHGIVNFICNAGGDLVCMGLNEGSPWVVGITNPFEPLKHVVYLDVHNMCVATSGTYRRRWSFNNKDVHHIMDPFLGQPVDTDIVSCSVIHHSLTEAEVLAKVALILGTAQGIPWLERQNVNGWIIVTKTGEVKHSCNL